MAEVLVSIHCANSIYLKMKVGKIKIAVQNSAWQSLPMVATLLLSLLIVRWFSFAFWGTIVAILVVQQIVNGVLSWGNKDYLQRESGLNPKGFSSVFSQLFLERFFLFLLIIPAVYFLKLVDQHYFIPFTLIVLSRFINQSFDLIIIRERRFELALLLDALVIAVQVCWLFILKQHGTELLSDVLMVFWLPLLLKSLLLAGIFRGNFNTMRLDQLLLRYSFSFGMLALSGLIHGKIDVFVVSRILSNETLAKYQIIMSFLWCIQSVAMLASGPFVHNFYRLTEAGQGNFSRLLKNIGLIIVPVGVAVVMLVLHFAFAIDINLSITLASLVFSIASFIYLPWILQINQRKKEYVVLIINIAGSLILIALLLGIHAAVGLNLETTLWIVALHQILVTLFVLLANKRIVNGF